MIKNSEENKINNKNQTHSVFELKNQKNRIGLKSLPSSRFFNKKEERQVNGRCPSCSGETATSYFTGERYCLECGLVLG